ncbi:MAG: GGDEF domain-containing protein [Pseudomonadota bacterium]
MAIDDPLFRVKSLRAKLDALAQVTQEMTRQVELNVRPIFEACLAQACLALDAGMAALHMSDQEHRLTRLVAGHNLDPLRARAWESLSLDGSSLPALSHRKGRMVELVGADAPRGLGGAVSVPVRGAELTVGSLSLLWQQPPGPDPDRGPFLESLGHLLGLAIEHAGLVSEMVDSLDEVLQLKDKVDRRNEELNEVNAKLSEANQRLETLSITDGLTGLFNHRHLHDLLGQEILRARRAGYPVSLIMADLDHFKNVNDRLGHQNGDEALRLVSNWLTHGVREVDVVGRYGGEEFLVILTNCALADGVKVAEKLRASIQERGGRPPFDAVGGVTISIGVAELRPEMTGDQLINTADQALYRAKQLGRNRVEAAPQG